MKSRLFQECFPSMASFKSWVYRMYKTWHNSLKLCIGIGPVLVPRYIPALSIWCSKRGQPWSKKPEHQHRMAALLNQSVSPHWLQRPELHPRPPQLFRRGSSSLFLGCFSVMTSFKSGIYRPDSSVQNLAQFIWNSAHVLCLFRHTYVHFIYGTINTGNARSSAPNSSTP